MKLGYLVLETTRPERWRGFADTLFGPGERAANPDGSFGIRLDAAAQRLVVQPGRRDDLAALGFEFADDAELDAMAERLAARGVRLEPGDGAVQVAGRVRRLIACTDPAGNRVELATGIEQDARPLACPGFPGGFHADATGFGHAVLAASDLAPLEDFYVGKLGLKVTERLDARLGPLQVKGTFLHCNARHHSLALMNLPVTKRIHHFMIQAREIRDVGRAFERVKAAKIPLSLGLGQHPDPDGTFSFYGQTPSGFDFEIGAGGREIATEGWQEGRIDTASSWGHAPTLRLRLAMARGLIASRFRASPRTPA
jgi:biphenyl-2,3-diol 1,2-dioxygenase